ncbi:hypothetical protein ATO6_24500, partial [Oceanicola sp. 22II-s10i]|uniref:hypothetical protein n=1 Tax=Oceanicola sp. 22II-s10i TaxID=1317116 RepID=UPI000B65588B
MTNFKALIISATAMILATGSLSAQVLEASSDATIRDRLCVGGGCADNPSPDFAADASGASLELRDFRTRIDFVDISTDSFPDTNWAIEANEPTLSIPSGGTEHLAVRDESASTVPFLIRGGAPTNTMYISADGAIGMGTSIPRQSLHIVNKGTLFEAGIRLEDTIGTPYSWDMRGNDAGFYLYDAIAG